MDDIRDQESSLKSLWILAWVLFGLTEVLAVIAPRGRSGLQAWLSRIALPMIPVCAALVAVKTSSMAQSLTKGSIGEAAAARRISSQLVMGFMLTCIAVIASMTFLVAR
jgi:hypothetical protein